MKDKAFAFLRKNKSNLTVQQYRTIKGQILKGDYDGAIKGIERILSRPRKGAKRNELRSNQK